MNGAPEPVFHLADGRVVWIYPLTFNRARIVVGAPEALGYDDGW